jgi:ADP-ribose pyrophosphatase YjhB (NUDIX family)
MHELQRAILKKLSQENGSRFSDLKPRGVESNRFMYHLRSVMNEGLVKKAGVLYRLTPKGKGFVDRVSSATFKERIQPKIVALVVCRREDDGSYLLYRRSRQPFLGKVGFPYGKIHMGERVQDAAARELKEKTGLSADLRYRGDVYVTVHDEENLVTQTLFHVFSGENPSGILRRDSSIGDCFWSALDRIKREEEIPGVSQVHKLVKGSEEPFFKEYFLDIHEE